MKHLLLNKKLTLLDSRHRQFMKTSVWKYSGKNFIPIIALFISLLLLPFTEANGQDYTWTGATSGTLTDASNWSPAVAPPIASGVITIPGILTISTTGTPPDLTGITAINAAMLDMETDLTFPTGLCITLDGGSNGLVIDNGAIVTTDVGAKLKVLNIVGEGVNVINGTLTLNDSLTVDITSGGGSAIDVETDGIFIIGSTGVVCADSIAAEGIMNNGTITNNGIIFLEDCARDGIENAAIFTNNGNIFIHDVEEDGINNDGGNFTVNDGAIVKINVAGANGIKHSTNVFIVNTFTNQGFISIDNVANHGFTATAPIISDGDTILIGTNESLTLPGAGKGSTSPRSILHIGDNGFDLSGSYIIQNSSLICVGDSIAADIGGNGFELTGTGSVDISTSSSVGDASWVKVTGVTGDGIKLATNTTFNSLDGTTVCIYNSVGNGVNNIGTFNNEAALLKIDSALNGINNTGTLNITDVGLVDIGKNNGGIATNGILNSGTINTDDDGTYIRIMSAPVSILNQGVGVINNDVDNDTDCVIIEVDNSIQVPVGTFTNHSVIITTSAPNTNSGLTNGLINNGFIADINGSFVTNAAINPRGVHEVVDTTMGVMVVPLAIEDFQSTIQPFAIGLSNPSTNEFYPGPTFTGGGNYDATTNTLTLSGMSLTYNLSYDIIKSNSSVCGSPTTAINFMNIECPVMACNGNINFSLGISGVEKILPEHILETQLSDYTGYVVEVLSGNLAGTDSVDCSYIGRSVDVMVTSPCPPFNTCWGKVTVEDKFPPVITCNDTIVFCNQDDSPEVLGYPTGTDACGEPVTFIYTDSDGAFSGVCGNNAEDEDTMKVITRLFTGFDQYGNSDTCTQRIFVLRPTIGQVMFPDSLTDSTALQCNSAVTTTDVTGRPFFLINDDTVLVEAVCKFGVSMSDRTYNLGCEGKTRIERTWTVMDWCHLANGGSIVTHTQLIDIVDTIPPTFDSLKASDIQVLSMFSHKCMATVKPPIPQNIQDLCSGGKFQIRGPTGTINNNPLDSFINVPLGETHILEYIVFDSCGNEARDTLTFELLDKTSPLAIAQELTVNLVDDAGNTWVYASSFDAGSSDNCGSIDSILVSKDGITFTEAIAFDCNDVGKITLHLKVVDNAGNAAIVSRDVIISDKLGFCDTDGDGVSTKCEDRNGNGDPTDDDSDGDGIPDYLDTDDDGDGIPTDQENPDIDGVLSTCDPADDNNNNWPDYLDVAGCTTTASISAVNGVDPTSCKMDGMITITATGTGPFEYSIDSGLTFQASNVFTGLDTGTYTLYVIEAGGICKSAAVMETLGCPTCNFSLSVTAATPTNPTSCTSQDGSIAITGTGSSNLEYSIDGGVNFVSTATFSSLDTGNYTIMIRDADDECKVAFVSNPVRLECNFCDLTLTVDTVKVIQDNVGCDDSDGILQINNADNAAIEYSIDGVNYGTNRLIGNLDTGNYTIFIREIAHPTCIVEYPHNPVRVECGDCTVAITSLTFTEPSDCDNSDGSVTINATGLDIQYSLDSGMTAFTNLVTPTITGLDTSEVNILIKSNSRVGCTPIAYASNPIIMNATCVAFAPVTASVAGHIQNENGELVESVTIAIDGYDMNPEVTGATGTFMFEELPLAGDYMITPGKDQNYTNGISTFDLVLLSKHILGINELDSPYKLIAADINHSGTISTYDMVLLRQVILGLKKDFPNNTSWRFIDASYEFINPQHPFTEHYPEAYEISNLSGDMMTLDFIAVKIGDLNNTAVTNQYMAAESRNSSKALSLQIEEQQKETGELVVVDFKSNNLDAMQGFQFTLNFDGNLLDFQQVRTGRSISMANFNLSLIHRGMIPISWNESKPMSWNSDEVLFSLVFKVKQKSKISKAFSIGSEITAAEAYTETGEVINVSLNIDHPSRKVEGFKLYQNKPNPFNNETIIGFELPTASVTTLTIFDVSGKVMEKRSQEYTKGYHQIIVDAAAFNEHGMYYYQLETAGGIQTKKMILLK